ncbi:MAG: hypothetical protein ASARMPRED_000185 [Alectoria sarmentosa]|nr:MAG: hypothetical protein ASARMPRED_000185 [Alectoria sarmentosa]
MRNTAAKGLRPEVGKDSECLDSGTIARRQGFLPLLSDVPQQRQTKPVSTDESSIPPALRNLNEKRLDLSKGGHATGHTFLPRLPGRGIDSSKREVPNHGTNTGSFPPRLSSAGALNAKRPSQEHREHLAEVAAQENHVRQARSAPVNCYEWPLIINDHTLGLIILHPARSVENGDRQPGPSGKEAMENAAKREEKVEGFKSDDKSTIESRVTDSLSAERQRSEMPRSWYTWTQETLDKKRKALEKVACETNFVQGKIRLERVRMGLLKLNAQEPPWCRGSSLDHINVDNRNN